MVEKRREAWWKRHDWIDMIWLFVREFHVGHITWDNAIPRVWMGGRAQGGTGSKDGVIMRTAYLVDVGVNNDKKQS